LPCALAKTQTGLHSIADQLALKFGDAREDTKDEPTICSACIDAFMQADEINPKHNISA
jgi:hypothetical protein